jgi:hypothetical protein
MGLCEPRGASTEEKRAAQQALEVAVLRRPLRSDDKSLDFGRFSRSFAVIREADSRRFMHCLAPGGDPMKAYVMTTGALFGLLTLAHLLRIIQEGRHLTNDPLYILITLAAATLCLWAWRLLRLSTRQ